MKGELGLLAGPARSPSIGPEVLDTRAGIFTRVLSLSVMLVLSRFLEAFAN